ncbi:MAG: ProQ/FinO family protein [Gammaproteobacteria bacterium]|nr:ProQ/FinO family protein [Gammaproteobacteria bacterium]
MSAARARKLLQLLYQVFPGAFIAPGKGRCRPLKTGIRNDLEPIILAWGFSSAELRRCLMDYTRHPRYWNAVAVQRTRVDLMGQPADEVSPVHQAQAKENAHAWKQAVIDRAERHKALLAKHALRKEQRALAEARKREREERQKKEEEARRKRNAASQNQKKGPHKHKQWTKARLTSIPIPLAMQRQQQQQQAAESAKVQAPPAAEPPAPAPKQSGSSGPTIIIKRKRSVPPPHPS